MAAHRATYPVWGVACCLVLVWVAGCGSDGARPPAAGVPSDVVYTEAREPCADRNPNRNLYFGDLHAHAGLSFDSWMWDVRHSPDRAYGFARGDPIDLPPLDARGQGTRRTRIDRPLDFAAITEHADLLGETEACVVPGSGSYDNPLCALFRSTSELAFVFGIGLILPDPFRFPRICGEDGSACVERAGRIWREVQAAAERAYDRSSACAFTSFVAYEYTPNTEITNLHRIVLFRNDRVPAHPASYFEQPTPEGLLADLERSCLDAGTGCDVISVPHNSNLSNGRMFHWSYPEQGADIETQREIARRRARLEPVVEIFQHKGDSECMNGLEGVRGGRDDLCDFEKLRRPPFRDCGDGTGSLGMMGLGCVSRLDYARYVLLEGLRLEASLGVNPYKLGFLASTDTHNATPGHVSEVGYPGHMGNTEDTPAKRMGPGGFTPKGLVGNPGGLTGVWAVENSRDAIFEAIRRREVYATSGPRIPVRFFGGWEYPQTLCAAPDAVAAGYALGVPMGADLPPRPHHRALPVFHVRAERDPAGLSTPLQRVQIIKGWLEDGGEPVQRVFEVAGDASGGLAGVNPHTCETSGTGQDVLCAVWTDTTFRPEQRAFYYARVIENPTCRWNALECATLPESEKPAACSDPEVPRVIQERAWTSPIWYSPQPGQARAGR